MQEIRERLLWKSAHAGEREPCSGFLDVFSKRFFPVSALPFVLILIVLAYLGQGGSAELALLLLAAMLLNSLFLTTLEFSCLLLVCNLVYAALFWWGRTNAVGVDILTGVWLFSLLLLYARYRLFRKLMIMSESNRHLAEMAMLDSLTGAYNRYYLSEAGDRVFHGFVRRGMRFCVLILDIDDFKNINDRHGHDGGDMVLIWFSGLLNDVMRLRDVVGRYGGDEFLIIMPDTNRDQALQAVWRLQRLLARRNGEGPEPGRGLRVSTGLAQVKVSDRDFSDVVRRADEALYESKQHGRNSDNV